MAVLLFGPKSSAAIEQTHSFRFKGSDGLFQSAPLVCGGDALETVNKEKGPCTRIGTADTMVFPPGGAKPTVMQCMLLGIIRDQLNNCFGIALESKVGGESVTAFTRTSNAHWDDGDTARRRKVQTVLVHTHSLTLACNILGYKTYVSSTAKDWGDVYGNGDLREKAD